MFAAIRYLPLLALALVACKTEEKSAPPVRTVLVQTVTATKGSGIMLLNGEVRARHESDLGFRVGGKVIARLVDVGTVVHPGQILARLDATDLQHTQQAARAQVAAAESDLALAKAELARSADLLARQFVSQSAYDAKLSLFQAAQARFEQAREQAAVSRNQTGYAALTADHAGVVIAVLTEAGQVVGAGQPVIRLAQSGELEVVVAVAEDDLPRIRSAGKVAVKLWARPELALQAKVREIAAAADPASRTFTVRLSLVAPPANLPLGLTATVELPVSGLDGIQVPGAAVVNTGQGPRVWVVENGKTVSRAVRVSRYRDEDIVLNAGLKAGDRVVVAGANLLTAGMVVTPREIIPMR